MVGGKSDLAVPDAPPDGQSISDQQANTEEVFQQLLRQIPQIRSLVQLKECCGLGLLLKLNKAEDEDLKLLLMEELNERFSQISRTAATKGEPVALKEAVFDALRILRHADRRTPPKTGRTIEDYARTGALPGVSSVATEANQFSRYVVAAVLCLLSSISVATLLFLSTHEAEPRGPAVLALRMESLSLGQALPPAPGEPVIELAGDSGHRIVRAFDVPPQDCVSASWKLSHKGVVLIDGKTVRRPSVSAISARCHETEEPVTLEWLPVQTKT